MNTEPTTTKTRKDKGLAGRLDKAFWRKHHVATMTADEEAWPQREPGGNLGRVFVIILLFHVVLIGAVVAYNIISPRTSAVVKSDSGSSVDSRIPPKQADVSEVTVVATPAATPPPSNPAPVSAPTVTAPANDKAANTDSYEVRSGDNLPGIAAALGVTPDVLIKLNDLENTELYPGRKILYPKGEVPRATPPPQQLRPFPIQTNIADKVAKDEAKKEQEKKAEKPQTTVPDAAPTVAQADAPPAKPSKTTVTHADEHPPEPKPKVRDDKDSTPPKPRTEKKNDDPKSDGKAGKKTEKSEKSDKSVSGKRSHVVTSKDTLYSIARKYGVKVDALQKANSIKDPGVLRDGMKLVIPGKN